MTISNLTLLLIDPNMHSIKGESGLEAEEHLLYQSIIRSCMYLVTSTRPDLIYSISYLLQFHATPSTSHLTAAKQSLWYIKGTKDLKLTFPFSDTSEITLEE
jgi:hypothetical protein